MSVFLGCAGAPGDPHGGTEPDAGAGLDAGSEVDAGPTVDAGTPADAGLGSDAGTADAGAALTLELRRAAAAATALLEPACVSIAPFYWEVGDVQGLLGGGSLAGPGGATYTADTVLSIASASKWLYSTYWVQRQNAVLTASDIWFFNFWSGYTMFTGCAGATTVGDCLDLKTNGQQNPATVDKFDYGGGHMQKHAALNGLADLNDAQLATELRSQLGTEIELTYVEPQLAGGASMSAAQYAKVLRKILSGQLLMKGVLGTHPVCTDAAACPGLALGSPAPPGEAWHYSVGHWLEDDPTVGDGAYSSAGAFGFYPWISADKSLYGVISRKDVPGSGVDSIRCGRLIRKAWVTGAAQ